MFLYRDGWARSLLAVMMVAGPATGLFAGETPSDEALAKHGLRQAGTIVVLEAESDVHSKATQARQLAREWSNAVMRQRFTVSEKEYQTAIKDLNAETNQFKNELNLTNRMINQLPKYRGRFTTNLAAQQNYDLTMYRTQLQWEISQRSNILNQIKSQPFDPKAKLKVDAEVRDKSEALHQAVLDLRTLVDETSEKYKGLAKNDEVKKLLTSIERSTGTKLKPGHSRQFLLDVKFLERLEHEVSPGDSATATGKSSRKSHRTTRSKRSSRPAADSGDSGSPF